MAQKNPIQQHDHTYLDLGCSREAPSLSAGRSQGRGRSELSSKWPVLFIVGVSQAKFAPLLPVDGTRGLHIQRSSSTQRHRRQFPASNDRTRNEYSKVMRSTSYKTITAHIKLGTRYIDMSPLSPPMDQTMDRREKEVYRWASYLWRKNCLAQLDPLYLF